MVSRHKLSVPALLQKEQSHKHATNQVCKKISNIAHFFS